MKFYCVLIICLTLLRDSSGNQRRMAWLLLASDFKCTREYSTGLNYLNEQHSGCNIQPTVKCGYMQKMPGGIQRKRGQTSPYTEEVEYHRLPMKWIAARKMPFIDLGPSNSPTALLVVGQPGEK